MSVAGSYDVIIKTPMGNQQGRLTVNPAGSGFSGSVSNDLMGSMDITGGTVNGDSIAWTMDMTSPMPMTLDCKATVDGNAITGTVKAGLFGTMALTGTRAA